MSSPPPTQASTPSSTAESTSSSPAALNGSSKAITMTPRTKIRSMLQEIDDDSGSEDRQSPLRAGATPGIHGLGCRDGHELDNTREGNPVEISTDGDEDELPVAPRGRVASRMLARELKAQELSNGSEDGMDSSDGGNAYERIKKQLAEAQIQEKDSEKKVTDRDTFEEADPQPLRRRLLLTKKQKAAVNDEVSKSDLRSASDSSALPSAVDESGSRVVAPVRKRFLIKKKQMPESAILGSISVSRKSSPGLLNSPCRSPSAGNRFADDGHDKGSDSDLPTNPKASSAFLALVAKKRKERQEREATEKASKAERVAKLRSLQSSLAQSSDEDSEQEATGKKLTQQSRPTRKASKRALEEMSRETQRLSRNMQLAHQARTKKKITKESFFARFNQTLPHADVCAPARNDPNTSTTASSVPESDAEAARGGDTPPTSPLIHNETDQLMFKPSAPTWVTNDVTMHETEELPSLEDLLTQPVMRIDKGKGKALEGGPVTASSLPMEESIRPARLLRVKIPEPRTSRDRRPDSDDDLEILGSATMKKSKAITLLDRVPARRTKEDRALLMLRSLANLTSPGKSGAREKASISSAEMQISLRHRARQQAAQERAEKIQKLKDRGVIVQTAEERERDQQEVEDLVERARQDAAEIGKKEKEAAKKGGGEGFEDSGDEDEDYAGSDEREDEISGSEDEVAEDEDSENRDTDADAFPEDEDIGDDLVEREAEEDDSENEPEVHEEENDFIDDGDEVEPTKHLAARKSRVTRFISDDEEDDVNAVPLLTTPFKSLIPSLPYSDDLPLGLTQAFAATMADDQTQQEDNGTQEQDSLAILRQMPEPDFPSLKVLEADSQEVVQDSQAQDSSEPFNLVLDYAQTQAAALVPESPIVEPSTQQSMPDPTQDMGFVMSPLLARRGPPSTIDTVLLTNKENSPVVKKKGRLVRRGDIEPADAIVRESPNHDAGHGFEIDASVFDIMRRGAKKAALREDFDKTRSNAKEMIEEVAEESEDEYAGLGGASDESAGEEDEEDRKMINDDGKEKVDEQKLAALYANKERASDEAAVTKLYKDITTGALRRKRGAGSDLDLSDSDDGGEAQRRAKRQEFQRMRQAMFADEKLGKIAEDKKKAAFLRAIEDREDDEDTLDLGFSGEEETNNDSQSQPRTPHTEEPNAKEVVEDAAEIDSRKRKRPLQPSTGDMSNRLPPNLRRTAAVSKIPSSIAEIREIVSFLVEEPASFQSGNHHSSSENEESDEAEERIPNTYDENDELRELDHDDGLDILDDMEKTFARPSFTSRCTNSEPKPNTTSKTRANVVDRLSLLRTRTSSLSSTSSRLAFHDPSSTGPSPEFRVPTLLRRATTNSSLNSSSSTNTSGGFGTERSASDDTKTKVAVGSGSKKASVNFYQESRLKERERELKGRIGKKGKSVSGVAGKAGQGMAGLLGRKGSWD